MHLPASQGSPGISLRSQAGSWTAGVPGGCDVSSAGRDGAVGGQGSSLWTGLQNGWTKKGPQITPGYVTSGDTTGSENNEEPGGRTWWGCHRRRDSSSVELGLAGQLLPATHRRARSESWGRAWGLHVLPGLSPRSSGSWALTSSQGHCFPDKGHQLKPGASPSLLPAWTCWERTASHRGRGATSGRLASLPRKPGLVSKVSCTNTKNTPTKSHPPAPSKDTWCLLHSGACRDRLVLSLGEVP